MSVSEEPLERLVMNARNGAIAIIGTITLAAGSLTAAALTKPGIPPAERPGITSANVKVGKMIYRSMDIFFPR